MCLPYTVSTCCLRTVACDAYSVSPCSAGLAALLKAGLLWEWCCKSESLPAIAKAVAKFPEMTFVLDHIGTSCEPVLVPNKYAHALARHMYSIPAPSTPSTPSTAQAGLHHHTTTLANLRGLILLHDAFAFAGHNSSGDDFETWAPALEKVAAGNSNVFCKLGAVEQWDVVRKMQPCDRARVGVDGNLAKIALLAVQPMPRVEGRVRGGGYRQLLTTLGRAYL